MKALVLYYSFSGNTRLIAETVSKELNADIEEIKPIKPLNAGGAGYVMWGLRQFVSQSKPPLTPLEHNPMEYDLIVFGTPVWSYTITPPIRTFLTDNRIIGKKIALFCCHGRNYGKTFEDMKKALQGNEIIAVTDFYDPLKHDSAQNISKAAKWAKSIINSEGKL